MLRRLFRVKTMSSVNNISTGGFEAGGHDATIGTCGDFSTSTVLCAIPN